MSKGMKCPYIGRHVVIRTYSAGVHIGILASYKNGHAILNEARRLWSWGGGVFTLSKIAMSGLVEAKIAVTLPEIFLTEVIEIIPTTGIAEKSINKIKEFIPNKND